MVTVGQAISLWETVAKQETSAKQQADDFRDKLVLLSATQVTVQRPPVPLAPKIKK